MLFFVVIFLLVGIGLVVLGRKLEDKARQAATWPVAEGQLEHCEVVNVPAVQIEDTSTWRLDLRYTYVVRGKTYHSTEYAFGYGDGRDDQPHRRVAEALRRSPQLAVRYNPAKPSEAVISIEPQTHASKIGYILLALAVICALIGFTGR